MKITTRNLILTALFAGLTAVGAIFLSIPIGPVPFTLQIFFTILSGVLLGSKLGALSQIVYLIMGLVGLPVFAGGVGGFSQIFQPSFGYLIGFILAAFIVGKIVESKHTPSMLELFFTSLVGLIAIYIIGFPYLYIVLSKVMGLEVTFFGVLKSGVLVFIPGDLVKCVLVSFLGAKIIPILKK